MQLFQRMMHIKKYVCINFRRLSSERDEIEAVRHINSSAGNSDIEGASQYAKMVVYLRYFDDIIHVLVNFNNRSMDGTVLFEKLPDAALKNKSVSFFLICNSLYNRNKFIVLIKI